MQPRQHQQQQHSQQLTFPTALTGAPAPVNHAFTHSAPTVALFEQHSHSIPALVRLTSDTSGTVSPRQPTASVTTLTSNGVTASAGTHRSKHLTPAAL